MKPARYEWDEAKRERNLAKHGVDLSAIERFDWAARSYGEMRLLAFGPLDGRIHAVVYTMRGSVQRIISLRKANPREQATYHSQRGRGR
jgi:uncharacterized protein